LVDLTQDRREAEPEGQLAAVSYPGNQEPEQSDADGQLAYDQLGNRLDSFRG